MYNKDTTDSVVRQLKSMPEIPCEINPYVTSKNLEDALIKHCKRSYDQIKELFSEEPERTSEINKRKLKELIKREGYTNISFTILPDVNMSEDAAIAEVLHCLEKFAEEKENGTLVPDEDFRC